MTENINHTFVILAYKKSPFLEDCIITLKKQTVRSHLLITSSTPSEYLSRLSEKYCLPIKVNKNSKCIGDDWTFAYNCCNTKYLTLAHQDDIYEPDYAEKCISIAEKYNSNLITFTNYGEIHSNEKVTVNFNIIIKRLILSSFFLFSQQIKRNAFKKAMLAFGNPISCPSVMYNKDKIGKFQFSKQLTINLDWDAWIKLSQMNGSFLFTRKVLMFHSIHEGSETSKAIKNKRRHSEDEIIFNKIWPPPFANIFFKIYRMSYKSNK